MAALYQCARVASLKIIALTTTLEITFFFKTFPLSLSFSLCRGGSEWLAMSFILARLR